MTFNIHSCCYQLNDLLQELPVNNTYRSSSQLSFILDRYLKILDRVNSYNDQFKGATTIYYSDVTAIRDNIQLLLMADSTEEKDKAFHQAKCELKNDLNALSMLLKPTHEVAV